MEEKWRVSHVTNCSKAGCYLGSCFTIKRGGRVYRSAMRMTRKRMWAAIVLRRRVKDAEQVLAR